MKPLYVSPGLALELKQIGWTGGLDIISLLSEIDERLFTITQEDNMDITVGCFADGNYSDESWLTTSHFHLAEALGTLVWMVLKYNLVNNPKENPF